MLGIGMGRRRRCCNAKRRAKALHTELLAIAAVTVSAASLVAFMNDKPRIGWPLIVAGFALQAWVHWK